MAEESREQQSRRLSELEGVIEERHTFVQEVTRAVEERQRVVQEMKVHVQEQESRVVQMLARIQAEHDKMNPVFEACKIKLEDIRIDDLNELKRIHVPHPMLLTVFQAASILLGHEGKTWEEIMKMTGDPHAYCERLKSFSDEMYEETMVTKIEQVQPLITNPGFVEEEIEKRNKFAAILCHWVLAMVEISKMELIRLEFEELNENWRAELDQLQSHRQELFQSQEELATHQTAFEELKAEQSTLKASLEE